VIPADIMAVMRIQLLDSLPDICDLTTTIMVSDGAGGWIEESETNPTACRVSPLATAGRDFEAIWADVATSSVPWVATFPAGTWIGPSDYFMHEGNRYEVVASSSERTWEIDVRVICRLIS
jgi:hypothetical protein